MAHANPHDHVPGAKHEAIPLDPEHDIDARSATIWFVVGAIAIFACLWVMVPIFMNVLAVERNKKISFAPTTELNDVRAEESKFLTGANPKQKDIREVVKQLRNK